MGYITMKLIDLYSDQELNIIKQYLPLIPLDVTLSEEQEDELDDALYDLMMDEFDSNYVLSDKGKQFEALYDKFVEA